MVRYGVRRTLAGVTFLFGLPLMAGCSSAQATAGAGATCGRTHTAAGVPVIVKVAKGSVN